MSDRTAEDRFFAKVEMRGECWQWIGAIGRWGYGNFGADGKTWRAHRWSYSFLRAEIPNGLHLDHLCRNRACVNPWHLEPVTQTVNVNRVPTELRNQPWDLCARGHALDEENTYVTPGPVAGRGRAHRRCKTCQRETQRRYQERRRQRNISVAGSI